MPSPAFLIYRSQKRFRKVNQQRCPNVDSPAGWQGSQDSLTHKAQSRGLSFGLCGLLPQEQGRVMSRVCSHPQSEIASQVAYNLNCFVRRVWFCRPANLGH